MPIIDETGRRSWRIRLLLVLMYMTLAILGVTMAYPFLITLTSSTTNALDYNRFAAVPRGTFSREERFTRGIVTFFPESLRQGMEQFTLLFEDAPGTWATWKAVGDDRAGLQRFAARYLAQTQDAKHWERITRIVADYDAFARQYRLDDSICVYNTRHIAPFFRVLYLDRARKDLQRQQIRRGRPEQRALELLTQRWGVPVATYYQIDPAQEYQVPLDQPNYWPTADARAEDFSQMREAYLYREFVPRGVRARWFEIARGSEARAVLGLGGQGSLSLSEFNRAANTDYRSWRQLPYPVTASEPAAVQRVWGLYTGTVTPACETRPYPLKTAWLRYLGTAETRSTLQLPAGGYLTIDEYNKAFGMHYTSLREVPFPVPAVAPPLMHTVWATFVQTQYPKRLIEIRVTPAITGQYQAFVKARFRDNLNNCNRILGTQFRTWQDLTFPAEMPQQNELQSKLWMEYLDKLPVEAKRLHSAEDAYQRYLLARYGSLEKVNNRYNWSLTEIEQAEMPFDLAYLVTFARNEWPLYLNSMTENYRFVLEYLFYRGSAVFNTVVLIILTVLAALTINPLAAYALSRFRMRQMPAVILFLLATMAFPAAVSMIPGFLLMRDLHLLNTYAALILPGIANGMSIFLLKGFFDSLPPELYEAASLDGAKEWQMFLRITIPLSKPILAVIALSSFMAAYNSWEWAIIVCQKQSMWTLAVWLYQFNTLFASTQPWAVMASFVIASLPVFLVFLFCQNIILRGIILPQMK